jgi:hypothetical protein
VTYRCWTCGGYYEPETLVIEPGRLYPHCTDRERCESARRRLFAAAVRVLDR